ncbi:DUF4222 domain-containing protein [Klebsiella michiganensis]|uniref:DUF4222 domain-containing protein n=1 Tax=Klebsiella michiganensis TaxID=1134687 RepID=UPI001780AA8B|nr:DUF4222 domain-containing protein [Citrobacter braakii]HEC2617670.1 DUF4222 domain-containing protein [Raoultella ornithinolytica]
MRNPEINDRWKDKRGEMVTVKDIAFNRVKFVRDSYEFPCVFPLERFVKEFSFVSWGMPDAK